MKGLYVILLAVTLWVGTGSILSSDAGSGCVVGVGERPVIRRLHLFRPDLIYYPIYQRVYA